MRDRDATPVKPETLVQAAADRGARIIVLPEAFVPLGAQGILTAELDLVEVAAARPLLDVAGHSTSSSSGRRYI